MKIELNINNSIEILDVEPRLTLLDFIRDKIKLKGTHAGCEHGVCGACTVILNGEAVRSCMVLAVQAVGDEIVTIEGINAKEKQTGELTILQDAFCEAHGLQCGYCTPGMLISAEVLLRKNSKPTREEVRDAISGNICRCTGYVQIVDAIMLAADRLSGRNRI